MGGHSRSHNHIPTRLPYNLGTGTTVTALVISKRAVYAASMKKFFSEKERSIFEPKKVAKRVCAIDKEMLIAINDRRTTKLSGNCDDALK